MLSDRTVDIQEEIATLVSKKVSSNLMFDFNFRGSINAIMGFKKRVSYVSISNQLQNTIETECYNALMSFQLSDTQKQITNRFLTAFCMDDLVDILAGQLERDDEGFNIVFGDGFTLSGLTAFYFGWLSTRIGMFIRHTIISTGNNHIATHDKLKNNKEIRCKKILSFLGEKILFFASQLELYQLSDEIKLNIPDEKGNKHDLSFVGALRVPHGIWEKHVTKAIESNTACYLSYENKLFSLACSFDLMVKLLKEASVPLIIPKRLPNLPVELYQHVFSFFTDKERHKLAKRLPVINKNMAKEKDNQLEHYQNIYRRK